MLVCDGGDLGFVDALREADDGVVRGMHLHQQRRLRRDRLGVVLGMRAVGGADLDQLGAGATHDVRHAEGSADLDQFSARDNGLLALDQGIERQQHGGGVVVDDGGGEILRFLTHRGRHDLGEQRLDQRIAVAATAVCDVVLERAGRGGGDGHRFHRFRCQQRAAEVGVQHGTGEVEDRAQVRLRQFLDAGDDACGERVARRRGMAGANQFAGCGEFSAGAVSDRLAAVSLDGGCQFRQR